MSLSLVFVFVSVRCSVMCRVVCVLVGFGYHPDPGGYSSLLPGWVVFVVCWVVLIWLGLECHPDPGGYFRLSPGLVVCVVGCVVHRPVGCCGRNCVQGHVVVRVLSV